MYLQLFIINRSGGLVFSKNLSALAPILSTNDCLRLGSTFHGLHAITTQIAPIASSGIEKMETDSFILQCLQTLTGVKFVITASPGTSELTEFLHAIYEIYADYVLKNPFYEIEMPIRCELFSKHLDRLVQKFSTSSGRRKMN